MVAAATAGSNKKTRPSDDRRKRLAEEIKVPTVSNFFPIERYYDAAEKVYEELQPISLLVQKQAEASWTMEDVTNIDPSQLAYDTTFNTGLDMSYLYAKRYCIFCVDEIPKHNYYNSAKYQPLKQKHALQMTKVLRVLERVVEQMDVQEQILILMQERKEKEDQVRLVERHRLVQETSSKSVVNDSHPMSVQESALEKLKILMPPPTPVPTPLEDATLPPSRPSSTRFHLTDDDDSNNQHESDESLIPDHAVSLDGMKPLLPPMVPNHHRDDSTIVPLTPPTPPSYEAVISAMQNRNRPSSSATTTITNNNKDNNNDTSYIRPPPEPPKPKKEKIRPPPPMRQQQEYYKAMYNKYQQMGKIQVSSIDTYQGRVSESTNGCTVISALIVARHLQDSKPFAMISNAAVQNVIDVQCGPILRTIRKKLGLGGHALIIPSDVHDHLVDDKILLQEQFTGAAGGNIMNQQHYYEFLQLLSDTTNSNGSSSPAAKRTNGKAGATLFFREHVISIVKSIDPNTKQSYYDLIDSMPGMLHNGKSMATRTRCADMESLEVLLLWYASRKFSDSNCSYIDRNPWDDNTADLDPRVFQGFVWSS